MPSTIWPSQFSPARRPSGRPFDSHHQAGNTPNYNVTSAAVRRTSERIRKLSPFFGFPIGQSFQHDKSNMGHPRPYRRPSPRICLCCHCMKLLQIQQTAAHGCFELSVFFLPLPSAHRDDAAAHDLITWVSFSPKKDQQDYVIFLQSGQRLSA